MQAVAEHLQERMKRPPCVGLVDTWQQLTCTEAATVLYGSITSQPHMNSAHHLQHL